MSAIHIIVAMTRDRVIGYRGEIPWSHPEDLQLFRKLTLGHTVIMGRTTYESIGHPLSSRNNIVISRTLRETDGLTICSNFGEGVESAKSLPNEIFMIGGAKIYKEALAIADTLHISWVEDNIAGDCFFPVYDEGDWQENYRQDFPGFTYCRYSRINKKAP